MTTQEVVLRPGDSISLRIELPGQPLRLDMSLTPEGVDITGSGKAPPPGAPTMYGGVPPANDGVVEIHDEEAPLDLTADFEAEDHKPEAVKVESLAAVEPFDDVPLEAQDVEFEQVSEPSHVTAQGDESVHEVSDVDDDELDISFDDTGKSIHEAHSEPAFQADAVTMVPRTGGEADGAGISAGPKKQFEPNDDDTLPVWTGKARTYRDPALEKKKTGEIGKSEAHGAKPVVESGRPQANPEASKSGTGGFSVFLAPPRGDDQKRAAAEIIAEIQGIDMDSALGQAGKMIVPVVKSVGEETAQSVRQRFRKAGLSCRITQKR